MGPPAPRGPARGPANTQQLQELEKKVLAFVQDQIQRHSKTPCSAQVCNCADSIARELGMGSFKSTKTWYDKFVSRHLDAARSSATASTRDRKEQQATGTPAESRGAPSSKAAGMQDHVRVGAAAGSQAGSGWMQAAPSAAPLQVTSTSSGFGRKSGGSGAEHASRCNAAAGSQVQLVHPFICTAWNRVDRKGAGRQAQPFASCVLCDRNMIA